MADKIWCLRQLDLFKDLNQKDLDGIGMMADEKNISKKEIILEPENKDKVYIIKAGQVALYQLTEDGKRIIVDLLGPGGIFGNFGSEEQGQNFAVASTDTFVCVLKRDAFFRFVASKPHLSYNLMKTLFDQLSRAQDTVATASSGNVMIKLRFKLNDLARKYGEENGHGIKITRRFTHEEIADMIGVSRETVTRMLGLLRQRGIVGLEGRNITFHKEKLRMA